MNRTRAALVALLSLLGPLLVIGGAPAQAAPAAPAARPASPVAGERVTFSGVVPAPQGRVVQLQQKQGSRWSRVATGRSVAGGRYDLVAAVPRRTGSTTAYRVVAPKAGAARKVVTGVRQVRSVEQTGGMAYSSSGSSPVTVTWTASFTPVRAGRPVVFQERAGDGTWTEVARGVQDSRGKAVLRQTYESGTSHTLRAVTLAANGADADVSATLTYPRR